MEKIEIESVTQVYDDSRGDRFTALQDVFLQWNAGESIAVMGESGSGKSTLARLVTGLEKPTAGKVLIDGTDTAHWRTKDWRRRRTELQAVFQDAAGTLSPSRSVLQNAEEALCNLTRLTKLQRRKRVMSLIRQMELKPEILTLPVARLSGGEQRRLGLLRSLAVEPRFLVLDEVTAGLDLISAQAVLQALEKYQQEHNCSYLVITHDLSTASRLCTKRYEIQQGRIIHVSVRSTITGKDA